MAQIQVQKHWYIAIALLAFNSNVCAMERFLPGLGGAGLAVLNAANDVWQVAREPLQDAARAAERSIRNVADGIGDAMRERDKRIEREKREASEAAKREKDNIDRVINDPGTHPEVRKQLLKQRANVAEDEREEQKRLTAQKAAMDNLFNETIKGARDIALERARNAANAGHEMRKIQAEGVQRRKAVEAGIKAAIQGVKENPHIILGIFGGCVALGYGGKYGFAYINDKLRLPQLVDPDNTSLVSRAQKFSDWVTGASLLDSKLSDVVLAPDIAEQVDVIAGSLGNIIKNNSFLPNIMFWGPPGTGKTMVAKRLAKSCNLDYLYFSASALDKFSLEECLAQITAIFDAARSNPKKVMIILDEAEVALPKRHPGLPEKANKIITHLLTYTGTETRDYMFLIMTNRPEDLDEAVLSRLDNRLYIGTPADVERKKIIKLYIEKYLEKGEHLVSRPKSLLSWAFTRRVEPVKAILEDDLFSEDYLEGLTQRLRGFTGRDISKLILAMLNAAYATADCRLTRSMVNRIVEHKVAEKAAEAGGFKRIAV